MTRQKWCIVQPWEEDMDDYIELFKTFLSRLKLAKFRPLIQAMTEGVDLFRLKDELIFEDQSNCNDANKTKYEEIFGYIDELEKVLLKYYDASEIRGLSPLYTAKLLDGFNNGIPG